MEKYLKFIFQKVSGKLQKRLFQAVYDILSNNISKLDIKKMKETKNLFRCRIGDIRIVFEKTTKGNIIKKINKRGDVY